MLIPVGVADTLSSLKMWAADQVAEAKARQKGEMCHSLSRENMNVFLLARQHFTWKIARNEHAFARYFNPKVETKFYFTTATNPKEFKEKVSLTELSTGFHANNSGDIMVFDEIQQHTNFTTQLIRTISEIEGSQHRVVFLGTPTPPGDLEPYPLLMNILNKIDESNFTLDPFTPLEMMAVLEQAIGFVPAKELIILWATSGRVARHLKNIVVDVLSEELKW
ncbi:hypothetical protein HK102_007514 [Quaeritorhiza haematococci]|nr:hypothetical protein HK102_007514 [Quaeritorhiza haematococci]